MGRVTVGYRYFLGMHLGICSGPVDAVMEIRAGDRTIWNGQRYTVTAGPNGKPVYTPVGSPAPITSNESVHINAPEVFGGDEREGGIQGQLDVMMGADDQSTNAYLVSQHGANTPAYRGILSLVWRRGLVAANNPYLKPWAIKVRRVLQGWQGGAPWYSAKAAITLPGGVGQGMNPAHIVYECITNGEWGMGYGTSLIDDANFRAAADTFYAEGFGLCIQWTRQQSIEGFLQHVMDHAGAILTQDRETGLFKIIPLRADYDVNTLPAFDESNIIELESYQRPALPDAVNEITVKYQDLGTAAETSITVQNLANITSQGGVVTQGLSYPGLPTGDLATRVALRDLRAKSTPLARVRFRANRSAANLLPGQVVKLSWAKEGIETLVLRVLKVNVGTVVDGAVLIEAAEDVFGMPSSSYAAQPPTGWTDPSTQPAAATNRVVREATYYETLQRLGSTDTAALPADAGYVMGAASRPSGDSLDFGLNTRTGSAEFEEQARGPFAPSGTLLAGINHTATSATLVGAVDLDLVTGGGFAQVDNEIIRIDTLDATTGAITFGRGVLDTVAAIHAGGARVYFLQDFAAADETQRVGGEIVDVRLTPRTGRGELDVASAPTNTVNVSPRVARPYPPGRVRVSGNAYPIEETGAFVLSWAHRNRLQQNLEGDESGNIGPEAGTTYSVEIRNNLTNTVIASATGIAGTSYTPPPLPGGTYPARVKLWSVRGGLASFNQHDFIVTFTAPAPGATFTATANLIAGQALNGDATALGATMPATSSILRGSASGNVDGMIDDVLLLLHFDGSNGSTLFIDSSPLQQTPATVGNAQLTTSTKKYGTAGMTASGSSLAQIGNGSSTPPGWDFISAGGDFTFEGWFYVSSTETQSFIPLFAIEGPPSGGVWSGVTVAINNLNPTLSFALYSGNSQVSIPQGGVGVFPGRDQWVHFAVVRESLNLRLFLNGQSVVNRVSGTSTYDWQAVGLSTPTNATVKVGASNLGAFGSGGVYLDDVRVTKRPRYTGSYAAVSVDGSPYVYNANFDPPPAAFPNFDGSYDYHFGNVVLLLHGDGSNGSTTITDSSSAAKTVTAVGATALSTAQQKFGPSSISFNGTNSKATVAASADFNLSGVDFTVECFVRFNSVANVPHIFQLNGGDINNRANVPLNGGVLRLFTAQGGSGADRITGSDSLSANTWYHVALCKAGTVFSLFLDGVLQGAVTAPLFPTGNLSLTIGTQEYSPISADWLNGYIDEFRVTKGVARYTAPFVPPTMAFPDSGA